MTKYEIPKGATHFIPAWEGAFDQTPTFMSYRQDRWNDIDCKWVYAWYHWYQGEWNRDPSFRDYNKRMKPIDQFPKDQIKC